MTQSLCALPAGIAAAAAAAATAGSSDYSRTVRHHGADTDHSVRSFLFCTVTQSRCALPAGIAAAAGSSNYSMTVVRVRRLLRRTRTVVVVVRAPRPWRGITRSGLCHGVEVDEYKETQQVVVVRPPRSRNYPLRIVSRCRSGRIQGDSTYTTAVVLEQPQR